MQPRERQALLYDGLYTLVLRVMSTLVAAATGILTARLLGPAGRGIYALPIVEAGLIAAAFAGLMSATSYYLLNRRGRAVLRPATVTALAFVGVGVVAAVMLAALGHAFWAAVPVALSLPATAVLNIASGYAVGTKRVRYVTMLAVSTTLATFVFVLSGLLLVARSPWIAIAAWLVASNAVALAAWCAMLLHARRLSPGSPVELREYVRFSAKSGGTGLLTILNYRGDVYVVALLASAASLGIYTLAVAAAESLCVATQSASLAVSPHIGSLDRGAAAALTARCVRNNLLVALVLCAALYIAAKPIVALLYGEAFMPLVPALRVLLAGVIAASLGSPLASYFTLKLGRPEVPLWLSGVSGVVCIALAALLVPSLGILGAAIASSVSYIVGQAAALYIFSRGARVSIQALLLPTLADAAFYVRSARRVLVDGRRALFGGRVA